MWRLLEDVRQRPPEERRRISFLWAGFVTGVIALVWLVWFFGRIDEVVQKRPAETNQAASFQESFSTLKEGLGSTFSEFESFRSSLEREFEGAPGTAGGTATSSAEGGTNLENGSSTRPSSDVRMDSTEAENIVE